MADLNDLERPVMTDLYTDVLDTIRENIKRVKAGSIPVGGGTVTGALTATGDLKSTSGNVISQALAAGDANFKYLDEAGTLKAQTFWQRSSNQLVLQAPSITMDSVGSLKLPVGTTAQRPTGTPGEIRYNSTTGQFEAFTGSAWGPLAGAAPADVPRSAIINGNLEVWQRGITFSPTDAVGNPTYSADRWAVANTGAGRVTVTQDNSLPTVFQAGFAIPFSLKIACTAAVPAPIASDTTVLQTRVEGYIWRKYWMRPLVLTFWVKATQTGNFTVALNNGGFDRYFLASYTINSVSTWEFKTVVIPASPSGGTWNLRTGVGIGLVFTLMAGSNFNGTAGSWQSGFAWNVAGSVNMMSSTSNTWQIAAIQLEPGTAPTSFEDVTLDLQLARCQRYYEKTFDYLIIPIQAAGNLTAGAIIGTASGANLTVRWDYKVRKRLAPTVTLMNPTQANANWRNNANSADAVAALLANSETGVTVSSTAASDASVYNINAVAESEL